jgi:hypothetical protein
VEVIMSRLFKVCFALAVVVVFYFVGYVGTRIIHAQFFQPTPTTQTITIEELVEAYKAEYPDATPWETCEQEAP